MDKSVAILGRQPELGLAELESLYGAEDIARYGQQSCMINIEASKIDFARLGGSTRIARVLNELPSSNWSDIEKYLVSNTPRYAESVDGKLVFGLSTFGVRVSPKQVSKTALLIKKAIKNSGHSVRMVPHKGLELGSAVVLYNKLAKGQNWELLVISDGKTAYLAQTTSIQDIDAYAERDQMRPMRDAKVGMLPPKLAQIIINLAVGKLRSHELRVESREKASGGQIVSGKSLKNSSLPNDGSQLENKNSRLLVLDPFCGTGVLLQEAMLMDYDIFGTDLEPRMVQYSIDNLKWLDAKYPDVGDYRRIEVGDATTHKWNFTNVKSEISVACETYLGQPLSSLPSSEHLSKIMYEVNLTHHKFLQNIGSQIKSGTRLCLAVPAWRGKREFLHLPMLDHLEELGYTESRFEHVSNNDLIYHRENQVVGRKLLVIIKN